MISVQSAAAEPDPVPPLEKVWLLVYGLPSGGSVALRGGKLTHIVKAISELVGKLITADLASFEDDGPARIEILCPAPSEIDGPSLVFYFGSKGRHLTFKLESPAGPEPGDGGLDDEGGSSEEGSSSEGDDDVGGAPPKSSDGRRNPDTSAAGPSGPAGGTPVVALVPMWAVGTGLPLPVSAGPVVATEEEVSVGMEVCPASSPRSPGVVCYLRSPGSPPSPTLGSPDPGPPTAVDPGWVSETPLARYSRPREGASLVVEPRQSTRISQSRILQDGRIPTIPELAARRAAARDLFPGTSSPLPSSLSGSRFSMLTSDMVLHLAEVAADSGIVFRGEKGPLLNKSPPCVRKRVLRGRWQKPVYSLRGQNPPSPVHSVPGHRETRDVGAPPVAGGIVTPMVGLPSVREPKGHPPTRLNHTETRREVRGSGPKSASPGPVTSGAPSSRGRRGKPPKALRRHAVDGRASSAPLAGPRNPDEFIK
ncbi:hypothetical protein D1007_51792 [Hordeum vulgare]|nr:hypothetical protein D1007_51792 [Hordeum vulgare]